MPRGKKKENAAEAVTPPKKAPKAQVLQTVVKPGYKMPDGMVVQRETIVEYEVRGDKRVITGPANVRPQILLGCVLP